MALERIESKLKNSLVVFFVDFPRITHNSDFEDHPMTYTRFLKQSIFITGPNVIIIIQY